MFPGTALRVRKTSRALSQLRRGEEGWNKRLEIGYGSTCPSCSLIIVVLTIFTWSPQFRRDLENIHVVPRLVFCSRSPLHCLFRTDLALLLRAHPCRCITGTSGQRRFFINELNVVVCQVSCVPEANGSAAMDFAPEPNGGAAAPPKGDAEEVDAVFFASSNGLPAQRTVVSLLGRYRYPSRSKPGRAPGHVKVIILSLFWERAILPSLSYCSSQFSFLLIRFSF